MAGTTPNYSWPYPESSDFVADGATAIENLADAADATVNTLAGTVASLATNNLEFLAKNTTTGSAYPSTGSGSGLWPGNTPAVNVTLTAGESYLAWFACGWTNTAANVILHRVYDSGTAVNHDIFQSRYATGDNNASAFEFFTVGATGARTISLAFASSTGTIQRYGSEHYAILSIWRLRP
jgi:hypothetical protein